MNQEQIKDRIIKNAAKIWGFQDLEKEAAFDPIVSLLLLATSSELEKISSELENSRARIIERVFGIMFPEEISGTLPARSILQVFPNENNRRISLYDSFKTNKNTGNYGSGNKQAKAIHFGSSIETFLTTASIKYLAYGNILQRVDDFFHRETIARSDKTLPLGEFWIGLHCPEKENLENLLFYFDINNNYQKELFFHYLKQVEVYFGGEKFHLKQGYNVPHDDFDFEQVIEKNYLDLEQIHRKVNDFYASHFFTLDARLHHLPTSQEEAALSICFPEKIPLEQEDVIWITFKFSEIVGSEIFKNIQVGLNCIPVINKQHKEVFYKTQDLLSVVPLVSEDYFLDLDKVTDDLGNRLDLKSYDHQENKAGSVALRKGGISRFDERSASELLQYLLELMKDETASFAGIGGDMIKEVLRQMNQNIAALHQLTKEKKLTQKKNPYLVVNSSKQKNTSLTYAVSYWSCIAEQANGIKPGTVFSINNTFFRENAIMITPSAGGRGTLSSQDKILEYRNAMLSRGRVVTIADIKTFGYNHFKNNIASIEVKKGTRKEISVQNGFTRTIDITVIRDPDMESKIEAVEWKYLCESFLRSLEKVSSNAYPYRLFVRNETSKV